jgi:hypothetical protein
VIYWLSGISSTGLSSSILSQPDDTNPRITFTVDGQKDILIPPGKPLVFEWLSSNIDTLTVSHTTNNKKKCDNLPLNKDIKGTQGVYKHKGWANNTKFIGCIYTITVTGKQTSTGVTVRESVQMSVVSAQSIPPTLTIAKITTESGEIVTTDTNIVSGSNPTKLIVQYRKTNIPKNAQITPTFILKNDLTLADPRNIFVSFSVMSPAPS